MKKRLKLSYKDIFVILILTFTIGYCFYNIINKNNGFLKLRKLRKENKILENKYNAIVTRSNLLEKKIQLIHPDHFDSDHIDEIARKEYGMIGKKEKVIFNFTEE